MTSPFLIAIIVIIEVLFFAFIFIAAVFEEIRAEFVETRHRYRELDRYVEVSLGHVKVLHGRLCWLHGISVLLRSTQLAKVW